MFRGVILSIALASLSISVIAEEQPTATLEYQVKAAFLYNFAKYVEWPSDALTNRDAFHVCILGENPFDLVLERTLHGKTISDRKLLAHQIQDVEEARDCHILFISSSESAHLQGILQILDGASILTVSEVGEFTEQGGMIQFRMQNGSVRFDINLDSARRAGLKISSQLLKLAINVIGRPQA